MLSLHFTNSKHGVALLKDAKIRMSLLTQRGHQKRAVLEVFPNLKVDVKHLQQLENGEHPLSPIFVG